MPLNLGYPDTVVKGIITIGISHADAIALKAISAHIILPRRFLINSILLAPIWLMQIFTLRIYGTSTLPVQIYAARISPMHF